MPVDTEYLRRHYASLSDDALLDINPAELVEGARACLEAELKHRQLESESASFDPEADTEEGTALDDDIAGDETEPDWLEEGSEVYSSAVRQGDTAGPQLHHARHSLEAEGIPCYLEMHEEEPDDEPPAPGPIRRWRILVPGAYSLEATGVIQREIFNDDFESGWRTHLETLSDEEVRDLDPRQVFCGLFDQVDRVNRAYREELKRRRLD